MRQNINATRCAEYLRRNGVEVSEETAMLWIAAEREARAKRRAHNRELKKSCGHFRTFETLVVSNEDGEQSVLSCRDCRRILSRPPRQRPPRRRKRRIA